MLSSLQSVVFPSLLTHTHFICQRKLSLTIIILIYHLLWGEHFDIPGIPPLNTFELSSRRVLDTMQ